MPNPDPIRSQPTGAGDDASRWAASLSAGSGGASGPNPKRPAAQNAIATPAPSMISPSPTVMGVSLTAPSATPDVALSSGIAIRAMSAPSATGAPTAKRISSGDQA